MIVALFHETMNPWRFHKGKNLHREGQVSNMVSQERRSHVRGDIFFRVKFNVISKGEYQNFKRSEEEFFSPDRKQLSPGLTNGDGHVEFTTDPSLIRFLLQLDEKLDQILVLLVKDEKDMEFINQGLGMNISGSGMSIIADKPVENGEIIHTKFLLSKHPLLFMDLFGEVVRVTALDEDGETTYNLGVRFIDLSVNEREMIIGSVFQKQREKIRQERGQ